MMGLFHAVREYVTPVLSKSQFLDKGQLTPEEFVAAGDFLIRMAPTWSWEGGNPGSARSYLPPGKQFLVTRRVACHRRVRTFTSDVEGAADRLVSADGDASGAAASSSSAAGGDWVEPTLRAYGSGRRAGDRSAGSSSSGGGGSAGGDDGDEEEGVEDITSLPAATAGNAGTSASGSATVAASSATGGAGSGVSGGGAHAGSSSSSSSGRGTGTVIDDDIVVDEEEEEAVAGAVNGGRAGHAAASVAASGGAGHSGSSGTYAGAAAGGAHGNSGSAAGVSATTGTSTEEPEEDDDYADLSALVGKSLSVVADPASVAPPSSSVAASQHRPASEGLPVSSTAPTGKHTHQPLASAGTTSSGKGAPSRATGLLDTGSGGVRLYDFTVTYDNYYRTPRVYLKGYSEEGVPLAPEQMLEDVMQDYANRTATIETHPHLPDSGPHISIHPCRHGQVMKRIIDNMMAQAASTTPAAPTGTTSTTTTSVSAVSSGSAAVPSVEQYLFIFLKFIASMVPTIEYDYTVGVKVGAMGGGGSS